ncbi:hypothetical protein METP2_02546 [Methanosarcinales archaeon]|uniref:DUF4386 domain-containing protein n=1 Tax=Candidatus Methanoperedens sp. BLZ2 TaxID=2035255 RepID=UPI001AD0A831|nr:DUF4386 domain-containing protein [Candidatus Methanoperedens sp. BLZ2]MBZ0175400.1 DUF4386 domain-containing protein [Candidatus Methanoperedens nitroreducens]MCX9079662.1 DUF4386 domain-containing protein [Candidatus Methanoperedens sp.]MCX9088369.1 DUF4386 domain-containing protein [Candidatus Methanoperedens sp.]CAG0990536.1 hypothetical protein METP2_02546 [Methanosarcinales archaeon]
MNRKEMNSDRRTAIIVGVFFLLGFAGAFSAVILKPILDDPNLLINLTRNKNLVMLGAFLELVMAFACANIAIWLYPVLKKHNKFLALGAVGSRIIENVFQIVATLGLLILLTLSQEAAKADAPAASTFQTAVALLLAVRFWAPLVLAQIAFCLGALMYYYVFYQSKLIPRWLSGWGIVAIILHLTSVFLTMFFQINPFSGSPIILLSIPIFFQELTLAGWLIVKGFNPSALASGSAKVDMS